MTSCKSEAGYIPFLYPFAKSDAIMSDDAGEKQDKKPKALALLSGGLDSNLAVRMMLAHGVDVEAVAVKTPFCDFDCGKGCGHRVKEVADELGIKLKTVYFGEEYLKMLKNPKHGYGSGMNPCIDCRAMIQRRQGTNGKDGRRFCRHRRSIVPTAHE